MKKLKKILSIVLSILIVFCSFPLISYANDSSINEYHAYRIPNSNLSGVSLGFIPINTRVNLIDELNYTQSNTQGYYYVFELGHINKNTKINLSVDFMCLYPNIVNVGDCKLIYSDNSTFSSNDFNSSISGNYNSSSVDFEFTVPYNYDNLFIAIRLLNISYSGGSRPTFELSNIAYSLQDENTGLLNSILDWLRAIKDSITDIPSKVQSFFNDLKTQLSTAFSNIGTWFTELGQNIGQWFKDLGDKIQGFFQDLSYKLTSKLQELKVDLHSAIFDFIIRINEISNNIKQSIHDFFVPDEAYLDKFYISIRSRIADMFGFLYESIYFIEDIFYEISNISDDYVYFEIPEIKLPIVNVVILEATSFYLDDYLFLHPAIEKIYDFYQISVSAIMYFAVILLAYKRLMSIIADRSDV